MGAFARVINAEFPAWLDALAYFTGLHDLQGLSHGPADTVGYMSHLTVPSGRVTYLNWPTALTLTSGEEPLESLALHWHGEKESVGHLALAEGLRWPPPAQHAVARHEQGLEVVFLQFEPQLLVANPVSASTLTENSVEVARLINYYLEAAPFFADHGAAQVATEGLLQAVRETLVNGTCQAPLPPAYRPDARIARVMAYLHSNTQPYNLKNLTDIALTSERNLYILMKKQTGQTPYQYHLRMKLMQVRDSLITSRAEEHSVSVHAVNKGFSHLGRFSAQYRMLFGELPSETLAWKKALDQFSREVRAALY